MAENNQYWNQLISKGLRFLQEQNNDVAAAVLKKAAFEVEHTYHDSWRWGTDYWALILYLNSKDYMALGDKKDQVERDIMSALVPFQKGSRDLLSTVSICQANDRVHTDFSDYSRHVYHFDGPDAMSKMQLILKMFRFGFKTIGIHLGQRRQRGGRSCHRDPHLRGPGQHHFHGRQNGLLLRVA